MDFVERCFRIPMRTPFRGQRARAGMLIHGPSGWGEFSPFPEYGPDVSARWLSAAVEAATSTWPRPRRDRIAVNVTVPAVDPQHAHDLVARSGCSTAKVKVGDENDEARVEAVRHALGAAGKLRVDANAAWDLDRAEAAIARLSRYDLEYVEQPVASIEDMARLRRRIDVRLAADESVRSAADPADVRVQDAADVVVLKVQPLGGVWPALEVAERAGVPAVVSSALETSVGIAAGLSLAAALDELPYACGLATVSLLEGDVVAEPLLPMDGAIPARRPEVDDAALARWEIDCGGWRRRAEAARGAGARPAP